MDIVFNDLKELYQRLEPALAIKEAELIRNDYDTISTKDIWDFLATTKWTISNNLQLHQMVDDILHASNEDIVRYLENR
jgi:hypothetical protein